MGVKYIVFDLSNATSDDYRLIKKRIDKFYPDNIHPLNTTYYVATDDSCRDVFFNIEEAFMGADYKLIVGVHAGSYSSDNLDVASWLKKHR